MVVSSPGCLPPGTKIAGTDGTPVLAGISATTLALSAPATCTGTFAFDVLEYPSGITVPVHYDAQLGTSSQLAALTNGIIANNTILQTGPVKVVAYALEANAASGAYNSCSGISILANWVDQTGEFANTLAVACGTANIAGNIDIGNGGAPFS